METAATSGQAEGAATSVDSPATSRRAWAITGALLALLIPVAHLLAVAWRWLYLPAPIVEELLRAGPLRARPLAPILLETQWLAFELGLVAAAIAWLLRGRGLSWERALRRTALNLLPLGLAPLLLFVDNIQTRLLLYATLFAAAAGFAAFQAMPDGFGSGRSPWPRRLAPALAVLAAAYYVGLAWMQHASYWTSIYDLGLFAGSLRSTVHGDGILFSPQFGCTFLAEHFTPILLLLVPAYAVHPDPMTLQTVMALSVAATGYLIYVLAEETLQDGWLALALGASFLIVPEVFQMQWHGFKMDLLEPPMIAGALLALRRANARWFVLCIALLLATKEDACVITGALGLYAWVAHGHRCLGPIVILASIVYGMVVFGWVIPAYAMFQEPGDYFRDFPGDQYKFSKHFAHFGPTLPKAIWGVLVNPLYALGWVISEDRLAGILTLLAPLGFLALWGGPAALILLLPTLEMLLSNFSYMYGLDHYYVAAPLVLAYGAAILGAAKLLGRLRSSERLGAVAPPRRTALGITAYCLAAALLLAGIDSDSPFSPVNEHPAYLTTPRTELLDGVIDSIPADAPVSASGYQAIHLMDRSRPAMIPFGLDRAAYVLIDLYRPAFPFPGRLATAGLFARRMIESPDWGVLRAERGVILLRRGAPRSANAAALAALDEPDIEAEEWEYSSFSNLAVRDPSCSNEAALEVTPADRRGPGFLLYGPFYPLPPGDYTATFRLAAARQPHESPERVAVTVDVFAGKRFAVRDLRFAEFTRPGAWQEFALEFTLPEIRAPEFRAFYHDAGTVALDVIRIRKR